VPEVVPEGNARLGLVERGVGEETSPLRGRSRGRAGPPRKGTVLGRDESLACGPARAREKTSAGRHSFGETARRPPASIMRFKPATRTMKNSSRFELTMATELEPLEEGGTVGSSALLRTRSLKASHASSRFTKRSARELRVDGREGGKQRSRRGSSWGDPTSAVALYFPDLRLNVGAASPTETKRRVNFT